MTHLTHIKTITNISNSNLEFNNFTLYSGTSFVVDDNLKSNINYGLINKYYFQKKIKAFDNNNLEITNDVEFDEIWSFNRNIYFQKKQYPNYFKLYDFLTKDAFTYKNLNFSYTPKSINYITDVNIRFARKETFTRGFLTNVEYYESSTTGANGELIFNNPVLNVNMKYHVNDIGYVTYRETTRKWQTLDNTYSSDSKVTIKQYNGVMSREEAIQRRNNIINQLIIDIVNITYAYYYTTKTFNETELMVLPLLDELENDVNKYIKGNLQPLIVKVTNADNITHPWLDIIVQGSTTLQDYMENKLLEAILAEGMYTSTEPN